MSEQRFDDSQPCEGIGQPLASAFVVPHPTRPNEDTFCMCPLWFGGLGLVSFFGVYDGHSGQVVSRFLAASLHHYVEAYGMIASDAATALCQAFRMADAALAEATLNCPDAGSTATVALLSASNIIVAHCGDSRALVCRGGHVVALTEDHRPARVDERERVLGSGGQILWNEGERVMGILQTTRAFGDRDLKQFGVTSEPEVVILSRTPEDELLILATDGVFNVLSNEEVADVARRVLRRAIERGAPRAAAIRMAASAIGRFSRDRNSKDDITVVLVDLAPQSGTHSPQSAQAAAAADLVLSKAVLAAQHHQTLLQQQQQQKHSEEQSQQESQQQQQQQSGQQECNKKQREPPGTPEADVKCDDDSGADAAGKFSGAQGRTMTRETVQSSRVMSLAAPLPSCAQQHCSHPPCTSKPHMAELMARTAATATAAQSCAQLQASDGPAAAAAAAVSGPHSATASSSASRRLDAGTRCHCRELRLSPVPAAAPATAS